MPRRRLRSIIFATLTIAALSAIALLAIKRRAQPADAQLLAFPAAPGLPADSIRFDDFAGSERCASCHAAQFTAWSQSTHGRAGEAPPGALVLRRFDGRSIQFRDATVEPRSNEGRFEFIVRWLGRTDRYPIEGVVGAGHMMGGGTQGFLWRHPDGSLRLLPFELASTDSAWFCSTATRAERGWQRITPNMSIADCGDWPPVRVLGSSTSYASCQECHGSQIELRAGPRPQETRLKSLTINCESCHGPGRAHAESATAQVASVAMPALATLSRDASLGVCWRCHALKDDVRRGYLPGQSLADRYSIKFPLLAGGETHADGRTRTFAYQQGHLYSDCYLSGSMTCVDCHEPHSQQYRDINGRPLPGKLDDAQCTDCHASKAQQPELHTRHKPDSPGSRCVSCHMPFVQEAAVGNQVRYTRSDHTISIPRVEVDARLGVVNACRTCHQERSTEQLAQDTRRLWGELKPLRPIVAQLIASQNNSDLERIILAGDTTHGLAYFDALSRHLSGLTTPDARMLSRRVQNRLWQLAESRDEDLAALALATLHHDGGRDGRVRARLAQSLRALGNRDASVRRRWAMALGARADALSESGRHADAIALYSKTLELWPDDAAYLIALGLAQLQSGQAAAASEVLQRATRLDANNSLAWLNYGLARNALGDGEGARQAYRRALEANPYEAPAWFNLGNGHLQRGELSDAIRAYRQAIELDVSLAAAHINLARALLLEDRKKEALDALRIGLTFDPNQAEARAAAEQLEAELGTARR